MGRRRQFFLGGERFLTKKAVVEKCRSILYAYAVGEALNTHDCAFMLDVLELHPSADEKVGAGVAQLEVRDAAEWGGKCFWVRRTDGTATDFSFLHCLSPKSQRDDVLRAMREAVAEQVVGFKVRRFAEGPVRCAFSGVSVDYDGAHVDHAAPDTFVRLAHRFLALRALAPESIEVAGFGDGESVKRLVDPLLRADWSQYHLKNARLRIVTKEANMGDLRRKENLG